MWIRKIALALLAGGLFAATQTSLAAAVAFSAIAALGAGGVAADAGKPVAPAAPLTAVPVQPRCADPAADIRVELLSKTAATSGRVRITGVLRNAGAAAWVPSKYGHRLVAVLAIKTSEAQPNGTPVVSGLSIDGLAPGQERRISYETNWEAKYGAQYPKFLMRFHHSVIPDYSARPGYDPNCRSDNDRKEIAATVVAALFGPLTPPPPPLRAVSHRMSGGDLEAVLAFAKDGDSAARIRTGAVPRGTADEVAVSGRSGTATVRVRGVCTGTPAGTLQLTHELVVTAGFGPLGSATVSVGSLEQRLSLAALCLAQPAVPSAPKQKLAPAPAKTPKTQ